MTEIHQQIQDKKTQLRSHLRQSRNNLSASERSRHNQAILGHLQSLPEINTAKTLFSYISYGSETDTRQLLDWLLLEGKQVLVPRISTDGRMIAVAFPGWSSIHTGSRGIPIPENSDAYEGIIDVCITPGLGFTADGARLGQGEGYYDRWFATHPVRYRIAPAFECQLNPQLPVDAHDTPVNLIVTEKQIIRVS
jgi:5-formyltetrahydrofolate cyclo-ligase